MQYYQLQHSNDSLSLKIVNPGKARWSLIFIGGFALFMFLLPIILVLFLFQEISFGIIISWLLSCLISSFFIRLYLWNKYGQEVFILKDNNLSIYNDYKYFKENYRHYKFENIDISFFINEESYSAQYIKKNTTTFDINQLSKIGFYIDNELIVSHREIPVSDIIDIAKIVGEYLNY